MMAVSPRATGTADSICSTGLVPSTMPLKVDAKPLSKIPRAGRPLTVMSMAKSVK